MLLRPAEPADVDAVARVHVRSWQVAYRGLLPDGYLDGLRPEDRAARYTFGDRDPQRPGTIVAETEGVIRGFATTMPARGDDGRGCGELAAIYVDPDGWDLGIGRALIGAARERLAAMGFAEAVLWVLAGNARAGRFYRIDGWAADGAQRRDEVWGVSVDEVRYRRPLP